MNRRTFVKNTAALTAFTQLPFGSKVITMDDKLKNIEVLHTASDFEREKLVRPFGFKGGFLTELWQTAVKLQSAKNSSIGLGTQSVLYGDADLFASFSEAGGNAMMYALTERALQLVKKTPFRTPIELLEKIEPVLMAEGISMTGRKDMNSNFLLNALISVDNAAWVLYAAENGLNSFDEMLPDPYKKALSFRNKKVGILFQVPYGMPVEDIVHAVKQGYFLIKVKTGQPGTQAEMLDKDMDRLTQIHAALKDMRTDHTADGKLIYTMDSNARYERKDTLMRFIDHARKIGAMDQILFMEEPLNENNEEDVSDAGVRIGADESVHDERAALRRIEQGYTLMVLKGIAKTLSRSVKIAKLAHEKGIPCICADLTVNPILIDWNKNLAARVAPFPGIGMGILETNGDMNYRNWKNMVAYHPSAGASWAQVKNGVFELDDDYYRNSGGILQPSPHYGEMLK